MIQERRAEAIGAVEDEIRSVLHRAKRIVATRAHAVHADLLGPSYLLLAWLAEREPVRAAAVVEALDVDKGSLSRQLHHLEDLGLVERRPDPDDGRAMLVAVTPAALDRLAAVDRQDRAAICDRLAGWSAEDLDDLADRLGRYNRDLG